MFPKGHAPRKQPAPPRTEPELEARARALAGRTLGEVAASIGATLPDTQRRHKGAVGNLIERALGTTAGTASEPDFAALGIELKTLPVRRDGRPRESTFVCVIPLDRMSELEWEQSPVRKKLARVLFVPIEAEPELPLASRRVGAPFLWTPSPEEDQALRADWDELAGLLGSGQVERVTGHLGRWLQVRPKGAGSWERRRAVGHDGAWVATMPRAFYLRAAFTERLVRRAL